MTTLYFVRHAEPNYNNHDDLTRELTENGLRDRHKAARWLADKTSPLFSPALISAA
jgi:2,3-bisphosphoglycerate-dependent phosphoglycerate mutase